MSEPSEVFKPLRLSGGRFDEASTGTVGFPLEVIAELARYERLLIKVARELWMDEHPTRKRAPKGFDEHLRLRLTAVETGSVGPVLQRREAEGGQLFDPDDWPERAQQTIADAFATIVEEQPLPPSFPAAATPSLVQFGSGFRLDEVCQVSRPNGAEVTYTQADRRHLVQIASAADIKIDGRLVGRIGALDANRQTFEFSDRFGNRADGSFRQIGLIAELRQFTDRDPVATFVRLTCRYSTDDAGHLSAIEDVDDVEPVVAADDPLGPRLRQLLELGDGWHDGDGLAPQLSAVEWVRDFAAELTPRQLERLAIFPTLEGGVLVERQVAGTRWSLEIDPDGDAHVVTVPAEGEPVIVEIEDGMDAIRRLEALES